VAKINPVKVKQDADKEEKAGRFDKAISLYRQILEDNPRDWNTINKVGDLYAKLNRFKEASEEYAKVADFYAKDGFLLKAIAIWKKINKLDASALEPYLNLADLYSKQGLAMEAKSQYQIVVDEYLKRGKAREAGDVLRKMADIDPADLKVRSKLADLYTRDGNTQKAVDEHIAIAEELNRKGHMAEAVQVLEKGLKIDAKSPKLRAELARAYIVQKSFDKAAEYLEDVIRSSPNDVQLLSQLGEAYLASNRVAEAEKIFRRLVELHPENLDTRIQMGRLCVARGEFDKAFDELLPAVNKLLEKGEGEKAASLLQHVIQKSPGHVKSLSRLAEVYRQLKNDRAVATTYSQLTEAYIKQSRYEQAASVLEMLVGLEPQNQQHVSKLQFVRSKMGVAAPAEEELALPAAVEPEIEPVPRAPAAAAAAAAASGSAPAIELTGPLTEEEKEFVEEHLAEGKVFRKYGLIDKAADQFEAVAARFPDHVETRQELADVYKEKGENAKAAQQLVALAQIHTLTGNAEAAAEALEQARALAPEVVPAALGAAEPAVAAAAPAEAELKVAAAEELPLTETEGELSLGESEEEIPLEVEEGGLEAATLEPEPEAPKLEPELPAEELPALDMAPEAEAELPLAGPGLELAPESASELPADAALELPAGDAAAADAGADLPLGGEELPLEGMEELGAEAPAAAEEAPAATEPAAADEDLSIGLESAEAASAEMSLEGLTESPVEPPLAEPEPPPPAAPLKTAPEPLKAAPKAAPPPPVVAKPAAAPAAAGLPADLQKALDDVDQYMSLGFVEDAKDALREVGTRYPAHPAILEKIAELGIDQEAIEEVPEPVVAPAAAAPEPPAGGGLEDALGDLGLPDVAAAPEPPPPAMAELAPPAIPEGGIDLGAELGELFGAQSAVEEPIPEAASSDLGDAGLEDIFKEFKKGVDKQLGKEDYDTRYNLGIAYKEMGLIDEAIAEFQLAAKDENRLLECSSMLGICFMEKGMPKLAVKWFEKGMKAPGRTEEEYQGLRYDLAMAYEASGEMDKALSLYTDLYGQDANFRDVAAKVRELRAAQG
jgi:tetratricopeptide (TPR) repeat protein